MSCRAVAFFGGLLWWWLGTAQAQLSVSYADIEVNNEAIVHSVALPYYFEGGRTGIKQVSARYQLPAAADLKSKFYGVLIPYPIQGGQIFLNDRLIYELDASTQSAFFTWYRPILLSLSRSDLSSTSDNWLEFRQVGHLRGWSILPVFFDEVSKLRGAYDFLFYLTQTLVETINYLCGFVGVFLIAIGVTARARKYIYPGVTAIVWVLLFKLALLPEFDTSFWFVWRLCVYALTGQVILFSILFLFEIFSIRVKVRALASLVGFCQLGWVLFFFSAGVWESFLDFYWTGAMVLLYAYCVVLTFWGRSGLNRYLTWLFFAYLLASAIFAWHDFAVQAGFVFDFDSPLWAVVANAVYLSHFSLPAFLLTACALLFVDYFHQIRHSARVRDEILADVHDGVGARLNVLLMGLELNALDWGAVKEDVRRCIDELRFVLLPEGEKSIFLLELISSFCATLQLCLQKKGISFQYEINSAAAEVLTPRMALVLYFAVLECLSNVVKHACRCAKTVQCVVSVVDDRVCLKVDDDGPGIRGWRNDLQKFDGVDLKHGIGVRSLIARVSGVNGDIRIVCGANGSTHVEIALPIATI